MPETAFVGGEVEQVWRPDRSDLLGQSTYRDGFLTAQLARLTVDREHDQLRLDALLLDVQNLQALARVQQETIHDLTTVIDRYVRAPNKAVA